MSKLIIWVTGRPSLDGYAKREFKWSELHKKFVYEGKEFLPTEFNAKWEKAFRNNMDLQPQVMVIENGIAAAPAPVPPPVVRPAAPPPPPPMTSVPLHLITVDQAEAVMARLAPERLKAKPGPKPRSKFPEMSVE